MMQEQLPTASLARLSPPPGGETRLRAALLEQDHRHHHRRHGWGPPLAGAFACLCLLAAALTLRPDPLDAGIRHAVTEAATLPPEGIRVAGQDVERVESQDPSVRIYRLAAR